MSSSRPGSIVSRRSFRVLTVGALLALLFTVVPLPVAQAAVPDTRTIRGTVALPQGAPAEWMKGVTVIATSVPGGSAFGIVRPDPVTGNYEIGGLASTTYRVRFAPAQYHDGVRATFPNVIAEYYDDAILFENPTLVDLTAGDAESIDANLAPGRTISGRVTLGAGADPSWLRAVKVVVLGRPGMPVDPDTGAYTITGLAPDTYVVQFTVETYWDNAAGRPVLPNLIAETYRDAVDDQPATTVDLTTSDAAAIDATLEMGRTISGRISLPADADGTWMTSLRVYANPSTTHSPVEGVVDVRTGDYMVTGLVPGTYTLCFGTHANWQDSEGNAAQLVSECYDDVVGTAPTLIDVTSADRPGADATLAFTEGYAPPTTVLVYRFWSDRFQSHFYTADPVERETVIRQWSSDWTYEGTAYTALKNPAPGTVPLYRFWSSQFQSHFYTASQDERDVVIARWPKEWTYEGIAYYVYPEYPDRTGTVSVTRFWSPVTGHHFYTSSAAEREMIGRLWPNFWREEFDRFRVPAR